METTRKHPRLRISEKHKKVRLTQGKSKFLLRNWKECGVCISFSRLLSLVNFAFPRETQEIPVFRIYDRFASFHPQWVRAPLKQFPPPQRLCLLWILFENNRNISITIEICITIDPPPEKFWKKASFDFDIKEISTKLTINLYSHKNFRSSPTCLSKFLCKL